MSKPNGKDHEKSNGAIPTGGGKLELPLIQLPGSHPCHGCGDCCRYIAIEIDNPTSFADHDHIYWYLSHRDVSVYVDWEGDWFIEFKTVCENLTEQTTCGVYEDRPQLCSDFSWEECEKNSGESAWKYHFGTPEQYHEWHREKRPRSFERYLKQLEKAKQRRQRVRLGETRRSASANEGEGDQPSQSSSPA